ncbi:MAG: dihydrodipicolinate synthase family protein [Planctomycetes bacterium]|nr:dihydrodipicolinate synthase family protein [Planctomycetota bacterium]
MRFPLRLTGLVAAPHTPLNPDGSLNPATIPAQARLLQESGVRGAFICGTTGESLSLTVSERVAVTEAWCDAVAGKMPIVVHVGSNSLMEARVLASHAAQCGADAIAAMAPSFFKSSLDELIAYCAAVAEAAPQTPLYYYDIPTMTNVPIPTAQFLEQAGKSIPTLHGVKFTNNDLVTLQECLALESFDIVFGYDELLLAGLAMGVRGAVGSTYNFAAPLYQRLFAAFDRGDLPTARQAQLQSVRMIRILQEFGFARASKAMMGLIGVDCGPVRLPLRPMTEPEIQELARRLTGMDGLSKPIRVSV